MTYVLTIPGILPGTNEYTLASRTNRYKSAQLKKDAENYIIQLCKEQLPDLHISNPVYMTYTWIAPNKKHDKDNIAFGKKFVQDGLVKAGILKNDRWDDIIGFTDKFDIDKNNPRIIVEIEEIR